MNTNSFKPLSGIAIALLFIVLGFYLIERESQLTIVVGYINIFFWSGLILLVLYKLITKKKA